MNVSQTTDFITELFEAANTLQNVTPAERRRLIERGIATVRAQQELLRLSGNTKAIEPSFMSDMPALAVIAEEDNAVDTLVSAGMLMLAGEIRRLRILHHCDRG
jgi:hypothetical protein